MKRKQSFHLSSFNSSRGLHAFVCFSFADCGSPSVFYGAGSWPKYSTGKHWRMEAHLSEAGGDRLLQLCGECCSFRLRHVKVTWKLENPAYCTCCLHVFVEGLLIGGDNI